MARCMKKKHRFISRAAPAISCEAMKPREAATIICYGQTGTGKTHTFNACWKRLGADLAGRSIAVTFFEIHGKKCFAAAPAVGIAPTKLTKLRLVTERSLN